MPEKRILFMSFRKFCLNFLVVSSFLFNQSFLYAQNKIAAGDDSSGGKVTYQSANETETFRRFLTAAKEPVLAEILEKTLGAGEEKEVSGVPAKNGAAGGWRGKIVYEMRYNRNEQETAPVYGATKVEDAMTKIVEITMDGDARKGSAKMSVNGKRTEENEVRQKKCCRSGGLGRCGRETVQLVRTRKITETYDTGGAALDVLGFINVSKARYSIEFTVSDFKGITKMTEIRTASGMCIESENKTDTNELAGEITFPPLVIKGFGEIDLKTPNILKGELQIDANARVFWELTRVGAARR